MQKEKLRWITCSSTKELARAVRAFVQPDDVVAELGSQLQEVSHAIGQSLCTSDTTSTTTTAKAVLVDVQRKFPKVVDGQQHRGRTQAMRQQGEDHAFLKYYNKNNNKTLWFHEISTFSEWRTPFFFNNNNSRSRSTVRSTTSSSATTLDESKESSSSPQRQPPHPQTYNVLVLDVGAIVGNDLPWTTLTLLRDFVALNDSLGGRQCRTVLIKSSQLNHWATRLVHGHHWNHHHPSQARQQQEQSSQQQELPFLSSSSSSMRPRSMMVVATVGVQEYRRTMERAVQPGHAILEVGCHLGTTTALLHDKASAAASTTNGQGGYCIGVDVGTSIIANAQQRYPHVYFAVGNAWKTAQLLQIQQDFVRQQQEQQQTTMASTTTPTTTTNTWGETTMTTTSVGRTGRRRTVGFDVIYVDVGGLSGSDGLLEAIMLVSSLEQALEPQCLVIKSQCLRQLSSRLQPFWKLYIPPLQSVKIIK